jgi:hypothetical protein
MVKNAGGLVKTAKSILVVIICLMIFAIISQMLLSASFAKPVHKSLSESYAVAFSTNLIKMFYPAVSQNAPKVDSFIKEKVLSAPVKEINSPSISIESPLSLQKNLVDEAKKIARPKKMFDSF